MPAVIDPKRPSNEHVRHETDERGENERSDEERSEPGPERRAPEGVPEVAVEQAVPREVGDLVPVVSEKDPAERVAGGEDRGQRPRRSEERRVGKETRPRRGACPRTQQRHTPPPD